MINLIKIQLFKLRKSKVFYGCLVLNILIVATMIMVRVQIGNIDSAKAYLDIMYKNYVFLLPLLCVTVSFASQGFSQKVIYPVIARGVSIKKLFIAQEIALCIVASLYCIAGTVTGILFCNFYFHNDFNIQLYLIVIKICAIEIIVHCAYVIFVFSLTYIIRNGKISVFINFTLLIFLPALLHGLMKVINTHINLRNLWIGNVVNIIEPGLEKAWYGYAILISLIYIILSSIISLLINTKRDFS